MTSTYILKYLKILKYLLDYMMKIIAIVLKYLMPKLKIIELMNIIH